MHPVELAFGSAALYALLRWKRTLNTRELAWSAFAFAAALCVHSAAVLLLPGLFILAVGKMDIIRVRGWIAIGIAVLCVPLIYAYLPLRSAIVTAERRDPTVALGIPAGRPFWDYDHPASRAGLRTQLTGSDFEAHLALRALLTPRVLATIPQRFGPSVVRVLPNALLFLALIGFIVVLRRPYVGGGLLLFGGIPMLFVLAFPAESDMERYFLPAYVAIAVAIGIGSSYLARVGDLRVARISFSCLFAAFGVIVGSDIATHHDFFEQPRNHGPQALDDRIVVTAWYDVYANRYPGWMAKRPVIVVTQGAPYLAGPRLVPQDAGAPAIYRVLR